LIFPLISFQLPFIFKPALLLGVVCIIQVLLHGCAKAGPGVERAVNGGGIGEVKGKFRNCSMSRAV
jgi:hypothetical protein